jgi:hypothetical protein
MIKFNKLPQLSIVCKLFDYDPNSGVFTRKINQGKSKAGSNPGSVNHDGYIFIRILGISYAAHRLAWLMATKADPGEFEIDHVDGNRQNNCFRNLRLATRLENNRNVRIRKDNSSGYKGVTYRKDCGKWRAVINVNKTQISLGSFDTAELAYIAYCNAAKELYDDFFKDQ